MDFLKNLSKTKIAAVIGAALSVLVVVGMLVYNISKPTMVPLFGELSQEDASLVVSKLQAMGKTYTSDQTGKTIMVPANDVLPIRMQLAQDGIPSDSKILGYEIFDKDNILGTSQFVNNVNEVRALEGELVRTINSISEVEQSRVHIVVPKSDYFSKSGQDASASVFVKVKPGKQLKDVQVTGIANLVAAAVPGLPVSNVAIIDQNGKPLKTPGDEENSSGAKNISDYKSTLEGKLKKAVEDIVGKYVGLGKVQANVVAEIDFDKVIVNQEEYNPDSQVMRSQRNSSEKSNDTEMEKNVSVGTNVPNFLQKAQPHSLKEYTKEDSVTNYEISKTVTNKVIQWGSIKQLSVAVLVDGVYDIDKQTKKEVYLRDRSEEELSKIKQLVAAAIGVDESRGDRVEVMNLRFAQNDVFGDPDQPQAMKYDAATVAQIVIVLIVMLLALILFMKPNLTKIFRKKDVMSNDSIPQSLQARLAQNALSETTQSRSDGANKPFAEKQYEELLNYLNSSAGEDIENTVKVIRNWILQR